MIDKHGRIIGRGIRWTSKTFRIDEETGEILTEHQAKTNYIKIKTDKHARLITPSSGIVEHTIRYRRNPQNRIFD